MVDAVRPFRSYPYDEWPRWTRAEVQTLRRAGRRFPFRPGAPRSADTLPWLGVEVGVTALPWVLCPASEIAQHLRSPLIAVLLEGPTPGDGSRFAIELEPRLASILIDRTLGGDGQGAALDLGVLTDVERGVLAYAFGRALVPLAAGMLRVVTVVTTPASLRMALGSGDWTCGSARVSLGSDAGIARAWLPDLERETPTAVPGPHAAWLGALQTFVSLVAGRATLRASELVGLGHGDVVVPDELGVRREGAALVGVVMAEVRGASRWFRCDLEVRGAVVRAVEAARPAARREREEREMESRDTDDGVEALLQAAGDVPVELVVELARIDLSLSELAALRPGEVLATGRAIGEHVVLRAGERVIARGELVDIEGEVGVRVLELPRP